MIDAAKTNNHGIYPRKYVLLLSAPSGRLCAGWPNVSLGRMYLLAERTVWPNNDGNSRLAEPMMPLKENEKLVLTLQLWKNGLCKFCVWKTYNLLSLLTNLWQCSEPITTYQK
uniref:Uncharacterized protein n=1 Tax=Romanomermis culicivorax TaxID=13658 RepID=A0A915HUB3_ROMCU